MEPSTALNAIDAAMVTLLWVRSLSKVDNPKYEIHLTMNSAWRFATCVPIRRQKGLSQPGLHRNKRFSNGKRFDYFFID